MPWQNGRGARDVEGTHVHSLHGPAAEYKSRGRRGRGKFSHTFLTNFSTTMSLRSRPLNYQNFNVSFPHERIVQVTLNRPQKLNSIDKSTSRQIQEVWEQFDQDESLWVGIITGVGRAFCTGADLHGTHPQSHSISST